MTRPGALAERLQALLDHPDQMDGLRCDAQVRRNFAWDALRARYLDLYRDVAALPVR